MNQHPLQHPLQPQIIHWYTKLQYGCQRIGRELNLHPATIHALLRKWGIPTRKRGSKGEICAELECTQLTHGFKRCRIHRKLRNAELERERTTELHLSGLCKCGQELKSGRKRCEDCLVRNRKINQKYYREVLKEARTNARKNTPQPRILLDAPPHLMS